MKKIKTTDMSVEVSSSELLAVTIGMLEFTKYDDYPWLTIWNIGDDSKEVVEEINDDEVNSITTLKDLEVFALNWYFNNVEIVKEINQQEQKADI